MIETRHVRHNIGYVCDQRTPDVILRVSLTMAWEWDSLKIYAYFPTLAQ